MATETNVSELEKTLYEITNTKVVLDMLAEAGMSQKQFVDQMKEKLSGMNLSKSDLADTKALKISCMAELCHIKDPSFRFDDKKLFDLLSKKDEAGKEEKHEKKEEFKTDLLLVLRELYELKLKNVEKRDDDLDSEKEIKLDKTLEGLKGPNKKENQAEYQAASKDLAAKALSDTLTQLYGADITKPGAVHGIIEFIMGNVMGFQDLEADPDDPNFMSKKDKEELGQTLGGLLDAVVDMSRSSSLRNPPQNKPSGAGD